MTKHETTIITDNRFFLNVSWLSAHLKGYMQYLFSNVPNINKTSNIMLFSDDLSVCPNFSKNGTCKHLYENKHVIGY